MITVSKLGDYSPCWKVILFFQSRWSWRDDITSNCLTCLKWVNFTRYSCLTNLVSTCFMEMEMSTPKYVNSYINILEKAKLTGSIRHIVRFTKSAMPIYYSEAPKKSWRRRERKRKNNYSVTLCKKSNNFVIISLLSLLLELFITMISDSTNGLPSQSSAG